MKLHEFLQKNRILPDLVATTQKEVLRELVESLKADFPKLDVDETVSVLLEREYLGSTAVGREVAIPHGRFDFLENALLVVGRSRAGIDLGAADGLPVRIFFLVLAPEKEMGTHLRLLAQIARISGDTVFLQAFLDCVNQDELWDLLCDL